MKKFYLLAAAVLTVASVNAKQLRFCQGDKVFNPGETLTWSECKVTDYGDTGKDYTYDPEISILSDVDANNLIVKATCTTGQSIQLCCGGQCDMGTEVTKSNVAIKANTPLPSQFEQIGSTYSKDEAIPRVEVELSAQYADDANTLVKLEVVLDSNIGVTMIAVDNAFRAVDGAINYNLSGASEISLYDMSGNCVLKANANGQGSLSTANLPAGIYVYSINGNVKSNGKIFVR